MEDTIFYSRFNKIRFKTIIGRSISERSNVFNLLDAIDNDNLEYVKNYMINNPNSNIIDINGDSLLHYAINLNPNKYIVYEMLNKNDIRVLPQRIMSEGRLSICKFLLNYYKNVKNKNGDSALHYAVQTNGNIEGIKLLLDNGMDIKERSKWGQCALVLMVEFYHDEADIQFMLKNAKDIDLETNELLLGSAVRYNNIVMARLILNKNLHNEYQYLLEMAINNGCCEIVEMLLTKNVNILAEDESNYTFLHKSVEKNHIDLTKLLVNYLDVNSSSVNGIRPLYYAVLNNNLEMVQFLLDNKADVNTTPWNKVTSLIFAVEKNNIELTLLLLKYNADVNLRDREKNSALDYALNNKNIELVRLLLENGATYNNLNKQNKILEYAQTYIEYKQIIKQVDEIKNEFENIFGTKPLTIKQILDSIKASIEYSPYNTETVNELKESFQSKID